MVIKVEIFDLTIGDQYILHKKIATFRKITNRTNTYSTGLFYKMIIFFYIVDHLVLFIVAAVSVAVAICWMNYQLHLYQNMVHGDLISILISC